MLAGGAFPSRDVKNPVDLSLDRGYYVGSISRNGFDPFKFPLSLNAQGQKVTLDNFDTSSGNLWKWRYMTVPAFQLRASLEMGLAESEKTLRAVASTKATGTKLRPQRTPPEEEDTEPVSGLALFCENADQGGFLTPDMTLSPSEDEAQLWQPVPYPRQRSRLPFGCSSSETLLAPSISVQIRAAGSTRLLCADERHRTVYLLQPADAKLKDQASGNFIFNDAWELTPDEDLPVSLLSNLVGGLAPCAAMAN